MKQFMKKIGIRVLIFTISSICGILIWFFIGVMRDETLVAGASWLEYSFGLMTIFLISSIIIEAVAKNDSSRLIIDLIVIFVAVVILIKLFKFKIVFVITKDVLKDFFETIGVIVALAVVISLPEFKKMNRNKNS